MRYCCVFLFFIKQHASLKAVNRWKLLTIFAKSPLLDVRVGSKYASETSKETFYHLVRQFKVAW